ncbi:hypothetical protein HMPREF0322_00404 [Desulfitobacterium hafniense DP7]|uniref:Uncharacterized protein n=1 Tax=Desulfitobacterium hafniense DP7 TaxID=537010 RepID=G9XHH9_DESHA|nr:hypothetical protein [Desulfitobacterium hafniense]EHL08981.1 hypothetical protein HMPREF0322_00404 [Desulfitobacterium hafniense DP7]
MFKGLATSAITRDLTRDMLKGLKEISELDVLVGIPQDESSRGEEEEGINNAELAYIHTHGIRNQAMREEMDEDMDRGSPYSKAYQMYIKEHGSPLWNSPPRPIIQPALEQPEIKAALGVQLSKAVPAALDGNLNQAMDELEKAGMIGQNAVRDWFTNPKNNWEPNSPDTAEQKGSDRPLIDTGELRRSIAYEVRKREG